MADAATFREERGSEEGAPLMLSGERTFWIEEIFPMYSLPLKRLLAASVLLIPFALAGCSHPQPVGYYPPPPPPAWTEIARQGFHDGVEAGRRDFSSGRQPDVNLHPRFRRPPVPPPAWEDYRHGFREGYQQVFMHGSAR
jgi:hypothetical protein